MAGESNMGISAWIGNNVQIYSANTVTIDMFGSAKFRHYDYGADDHVAVIHSENWSHSAVLFLTAAIHKASYAGQFDYSRNFYASDADELNILLPTVKLDGKSQIAVEFMEAFIATLNAERIATLNAYLQTTGLNDYTLTVGEEAALAQLETVTWGQFKIGELFEKLNLRNHNKAFDKLLDTSTVKTAEFNLPLVNAKLGSNGIMFYGREQDFDSAEMTIDVISNGAVATGTVYAQPKRVGVLWDAYLLKPNYQDMSKEKLLYLTASLQKSIKTKFGWEDKAVWSKVQHEVISLPIRSGNTPDYDYMASLISAMQKVVIKNVVDYLDQEIEKTKQLIE